MTRSLQHPLSTDERPMGYQLTKGCCTLDRETEKWTGMEDEGLGRWATPGTEAKPL
jgi:hypothetical protein